MVSQLTTNGEGLRLFFTDDIYLVNEPDSTLKEESQTYLKEEVPSLAQPSVVSEPAVSLIKEQPEFKFLGNNNRNILILVNDEQNDVSDEKGRELLRKIVKSINLSASDFALLNYAKYKGASYEQLKARFSSVIVFAFGVSAEQLGLKKHPENMVITEGGVKLIFSSALQKLDEDTNGKKVLWGSLKQLGL
ncbi:hypothetical protein [Pedobacter sp. B4-66]|uniref:hypothetical protein n=1 Tax=Pedobacter sp. B4-66 TaxID=2817280 RepID=UPI001BDA7EA0|nr:hypothetical protein [Pedobacter sp. B4-66]